MTRRNRALLVLAVSGILGFRVGIVGFPTWQIAVETAQVVAGVVRYPDGNPFYVYHTKLWSLLIQICALLLKAGVSEITLSLLVSGLLGMISFQALSLVVYAIGGDAIVAIGAAFVFFVSGVTDHGAVYPVTLMGTHHTYGAIGLSLFVLAVGLLGAGCRRTGGFLLGIAPAVHPSVGVWVGAAVAISLAWDFRGLREEFRPALKFFLAGAAVTVFSLLAQVTLIYDVPAVDAAEVAKYYSVFVSTWDAHRRAAIAMDSYGAVFNRTALALGLIWIVGFARDLPRSAVFLLRVVVVSAVLSLLSVVVSWLPPDRLPVTLSILMPARLVNFNVLVIGPVLLGLLCAYRQNITARALTLFLLAAVLLARTSRLWDWGKERGWTPWTVHPDPALVYQTIALGLVLLMLWRLHRQRIGRPIDDVRVPLRRWAAAGALRAASFAVLAAAVAIGWRVTGPRDIFRDRTNDPFYRTMAADRRGITVTAGSFQLVQLYTRRPVLIDSGALDTMVYAPESSPALVAILRDVYGIDFLDPPAFVRSGSQVPHHLNVQIWERFSTEQWRELRRTYNVSQVVTRSDYLLHLPISAETDGLRLYRIPD